MAAPWRRSPLPANWAQLRRVVLRRDRGRCQIQGPGCVGVASEVDHIDGHSDHGLHNLQAVCTPCHREKTSRSAGRASQARRRREGLDAYGRQKRRRPEERHPGLK